jgi:hypothetical protein
MRECGKRKKFIWEFRDFELAAMCFFGFGISFVNVPASLAYS